MKRYSWVLALFSFLMAAGALAQDPLPTFDALEPGVWTMLSPGGDTICSNGTPYNFFARPAETDTDKLHIHFQGGGACWTGTTCDLGGGQTYDAQSDQGDNPTTAGGIFNFENEENPLRDYHTVMVSYCTGDVHLGNRDVEYTNGNDTFTLQHRGMTNAMTTLDWVFENIEDPETVFVSGCSAGAIPAPYYTQFIGEQYPNARIEHFSDSGGAYRNPEFNAIVFDQWGTLSGLPENYREYTLDTLNFESFYIETANLLPDATLSQFNHASDNVQRFFLGLTGMRRIQVEELLRANFDDINAAAENDNFRTYLSGGRGHCITPTDDFYTYETEGVRLVDWVAELAAGEAVEDVLCTNCRRAGRTDSD